MSCWRNLEMSGPKRRAPMSYCAEPAGPAGGVDAAVPESIRLPEYRVGFSGVWLSVSPVVSDWLSVLGASLPPYASYPYEALTLPASVMGCELEPCTSVPYVYVSVTPVGLFLSDICNR